MPCSPVKLFNRSSATESIQKKAEFAGNHLGSCCSCGSVPLRSFRSDHLAHDAPVVNWHPNCMVLIKYVFSHFQGNGSLVRGLWHSSVRSETLRARPHSEVFQWFKCVVHSNGFGAIHSRGSAPCVQGNKRGSRGWRVRRIP